MNTNLKKEVDFEIRKNLTNGIVALGGNISHMKHLLKNKYVSKKAMLEALNTQMELLKHIEKSKNDLLVKLSIETPHGLSVKDYTKFKIFDYNNDLSNPNFILGQVVINIERGKINEDNGNPIGVVIQLHPDGDCRTDMFGNTSTDEVRLATLDEVKKYRKDILNDLDK